MTYTLRFEPLVWTGPTNPYPQRSRFLATWADTLKILSRELEHLDADPATVTLQVDADPRRIRRDGQLASNALVNWHGVILSFTGKHGPLSYPCDTYNAGAWSGDLKAWQANVRAIALGLEALRAVDRWGITQTGQQYTGFKALGSGTPMPAATMTVEQAARFLIEHAGPDLGEMELGRVIYDLPVGVRARTYRKAAKRLHPDVGGDPALFKRLNEARDLLEAQS